MTRLSLVLLLFLIGHTVVNGQTIRVVDENGAPVGRFEAMYHTSDFGYCGWEPGSNGTWRLRHSTGQLEVIDVLVRADGYATTIQRFKNELLSTLREGKAIIELAKGREVKLLLNLPDGMQLPNDLLPQTYPPEFAWRVRSMWQPHNQRAGDSDFNLLNVHRSADGNLTFRLLDKPTTFLVAFHHGGWLRFYEAGPFSNHNFVNDTLTLDIPKPATIEIRFDTGGSPAASLPFDRVYCDVAWPNPERNGSVYSVTQRDQVVENGFFRITDLGPGKYTVGIRTEPKKESKLIESTEINPGRFHELRKVEVLAGQIAKEAISFVPYDERTKYGPGNARIKVILPNGEPAKGKPLKIVWFDGHYGWRTILNRSVPDDGVVLLNGFSTKFSSVNPFGPYTVRVGDSLLGFFRLNDTEEIQNFEFRMTPGIGDAAPDFSLFNVRTKEKRRLSDFRGKIVLVEFWATWCGPCQPAMSELVELFVANQAKWGDTVAIIPLSTDDSLDRASQHTTSKGWDIMPQYWTERNEQEHFTAAEVAYVVHGIPHAVLIDPNGRIAWRGHPMNPTDGMDIIGRIEALRTP